MSFFNRPFFFQCGLARPTLGQSRGNHCMGSRWLEVYGEPWKRLAGEPLVQIDRSEVSGYRTWQVWMPGVKLVVCLAGKPAQTCF